MYRQVTEYHCMSHSSDMYLYNILITNLQGMTDKMTQTLLQEIPALLFSAVEEYLLAGLCYTALAVGKQWFSTFQLA